MADVIVATASKQTRQRPPAGSWSRLTFGRVEIELGSFLIAGIEGTL